MFISFYDHGNEVGHSPPPLHLFPSLCIQSIPAQFYHPASHGRLSTRSPPFGTTNSPWSCQSRHLPHAMALANLDQKRPLRRAYHPLYTISPQLSQTKPDIEATDLQSQRQWHQRQYVDQQSYLPCTLKGQRRKHQKSLDGCDRSYEDLTFSNLYIPYFPACRS